MSSLRNILQRCARNRPLSASILGGTPLQIQCTFNHVCSAYPTSISRQAYSSDANKTPENDPVQKYFLEMMNAKKSRSNIVPEDKKSTKSFTADSAQKTPFQQMYSKNYPPNVPADQKSESTAISRHAYTSDVNEAPKNATKSVQKIPLGQIDLMKSPPKIAKDEKVSKCPTSNKNLNLRKYYISIFDLPNEITHESLREFYSQFGEIVVCDFVFKSKPNQFGNIAFSSRIAMYRALNSLPHCIDGKEINDVRPSNLGKRQLSLKVTNLSDKTTIESLKEFYSRFGCLNCWIDYNKTSNSQFGDVIFATQNDLHLALDSQPHIIDGSEVFLQYATYDLDFLIGNMPEGIPEKELIAFYSKYGQLRECRLGKGKTGISNAYISYSAIDEFNRAMDDRPHIIHGKPLNIQFLGKGHGSIPVSLFVGSLPGNVTEETLRNEFSKYGKPVFWKIENDGRFNQSGPYGIVMYGSEEEALKVLNSGPHTIEGAVVDVRKAKEVRPSSREKYYY
ncbi:RNA recognition motif domain-containing protein [Ditylenchus destructor]|nr:RNA recognition motif domain-containing protein [Ditylenchus destructor]